MADKPIAAERHPSGHTLIVAHSGTYTGIGNGVRMTPLRASLGSIASVYEASCAGCPEIDGLGTDIGAR